MRYPAHSKEARLSFSPRCAEKVVLSWGIHPMPASVAGRVRIDPLLRQPGVAHLLLRSERQLRGHFFYKNAQRSGIPTS
jgi:hypothetical protein